MDHWDASVLNIYTWMLKSPNYLNYALLLLLSLMPINLCYRFIKKDLQIIYIIFQMATKRKYQRGMVE